jgi:zinc-ribbon domain
MTLFCTNCGTTVAADTRFCTACGAAREISEGSRPTVAMAGVPTPAAKRRRVWPWWVLAVIAFFLLGLWLGRGPAAKKPVCGGPATVQGGPGKLMQGPGQPTKVGRGGPGDVPPLAGSGGNVKIPPGDGLDGLGKDGNTGDLGSGGGGKAPMADGDEPTSSSGGQGDQLKHDLTRFTQGKGGQNIDADDHDAKAAPQGKSYSANDFTFDKTNLPRYPDAVDAVVSSISYGPDGKTDSYSTGAGIVTSSSFDTVVSWYRQNLPPGWHDMTIGDMQLLSKQLSPQAIMQMLGQQPSDPAAPSDASGATSAADQVRLSLFSPPAGSRTKSGVMIVQHGDSAVEALLQAKVAPSP